MTKLNVIDSKRIQMVGGRNVGDGTLGPSGSYKVRCSQGSRTGEAIQLLMPESVLIIIRDWRDIFILFLLAL